MEKGNAKTAIIILVILIILAGGFLGYKIVENKNKNVETANEQNEENNVIITGISKKEEKQVQIYNGKDRPIAVMIDNHNQAWPQVGLQKAYMVYEAIAEGGETRLMAMFKGVDVEQIGPVRSSRHYFLDYAMENDAIYVHFGWSPQAQEDISTLGVNNINGIYESSTAFWRVNEKYAPHNVVTSTEDIMNIAERKGYRTTTEQEPVLNYVVSEVNLEDGKTATDIVIPYSDYNSVEYKYDKESKEYVRYSRGEKQVDWTSGDTITTKNIIIEFAENTTIDDGSGKGRQTLDNVKELDGYYITNGKVIPITCTKDSRTSQTVYKDAEGNEIEVNDGKTFIQICPLDSDVTFVEE